MIPGADYEPLAAQKRLFGNTMLLSASEAVVQLLNLAFAILLARIYGPVLLGVYSYAMAIGALLCILVSLGTHGLILRRASLQSEHATTATGALFGFQLSVALALVLATHLAARSLSSSPLMAWVVTLIAGYHVLTRVTSLLVIGFTARQQMGPASVLPLARQGLALLLACAAMTWDADARITLAALPASALLVLAGMYVFTARHLGRPALRFRRAEIGGYLREGQPYFHVVALNTLYSRLGIIVLTLLSGEAVAGVFAAAERLVVAVGTIQVVFSIALLPMVAQLWKAEHSRFMELTQRVARLTLLVTLPTATMLALFAKDIVQLIYADEFGDSAVVLEGIAWILVVRGIAQLLATITTATDHQPILVRVRSLGLVVLTVASLGLIPHYGARGLVIAMLASEMCAVVLNLVMLRRAGVPTTTFSGGVRVIPACLLAAGLAWFLSEAAFVLRLLVVAAGGATALWLFGAVRDQDFRYLRAILRARESGARPAQDV